MKFYENQPFKNFTHCREKKLVFISTHLYITFKTTLYTQGFPQRIRLQRRPETLKKWQTKGLIESFLNIVLLRDYFMVWQRKKQVYSLRKLCSFGNRSINSVKSSLRSHPLLVTLFIFSWFKIFWLILTADLILEFWDFHNLSKAY